MFFNSAFRSDNYHSKEISTEDFISVRNKLTVMSQKVAFSEMFKLLTANKSLPSSS